MAGDLTRQDFLRAGAAITVTTALPAEAQPRRRKAPRAITMWDFSWLERRWDGGSYKDWDRALDELVERGYDAVRIDAYPHFFSGDAAAERTLVPIWNQQDWGSPDTIKVRVMPALIQFIAKCRQRGVMVGLSSWFREDAGNVRMRLTRPEALAEAWLKTIAAIARAGLLDAILYVDLCNEWPANLWAPYFSKDKKSPDDWSEPAALAYMNKALALVRAEHPRMPLLYSLTLSRIEPLFEHDLSALDALEQHIWMTQNNGDEFYKQIGYEYDRFDPKGYRTLVAKAEAAYRARPEYWQAELLARIDLTAAAGRKWNRPIMTTECWAVVDYKDWPMLDWGWVKELCALGTKRASASGRWLAIATSNFCGPQFAGMWRDIAWHRALTSTIKQGPVDAELKTSKLWSRL